MIINLLLQEDPGQGRLRLHSAEDSNFHSSTSLNESPNSESPRSWPSTFTTPMSYIKERKKRKASKFHIASPFDGDESKDNLFGGAEEHNLSQSIHSDSVSFASISDSPAGGEEENDGAASSRARAADYQLHFQQLRLQVIFSKKRRTWLHLVSFPRWRCSRRLSPTSRQARWPPMPSRLSSRRRWL